MEPAARLATERLVLQPVTLEIARAVVAGDLAALPVADGWPHDDTRDAMAMAIQQPGGAMWLITVDGRVIGDCGTLGVPNQLGEVEIGYGLAVPSRGSGYATEAAGAVCEWLFTQADVTRISAVGVLADNHASRRVLAKLGFTIMRENDEHVSYALTPDRLDASYLFLR